MKNSLLIILLSILALVASAQCQHTATYWYEKGWDFYNHEQYDEAIKAYNDAINLDPNFVNAWIEKGNALYGQGKYEESIAIYEEAIRIDQNSTIAWINKGGALNKQGKYEEAIQACNNAIKLDPNLTRAWGIKGKALKAIGRTIEGDAALEKSNELKLIAKATQEEIIAQNDKGMQHMNEGNYEEAIKDFDKSIEIDPRHNDVSIAWLYKGDSLQEIGNYTEAIKAYDNAINLSPSLGEAWNEKAKALESLGKNDEATIAREKAIEINPRYGNATTPVHIKMGPYDVTYNDYEPTKWATDSYPVYDYNSFWENNELKTSRSPKGMVYHAVSEDEQEIWITHLTSEAVDAPSVVIGKHLADGGYQDSYKESIIKADTHSDVDGHPAKTQSACKRGTLNCINLVAWAIDDQTICEYRSGASGSYVLKSIHIES